MTSSVLDRVDENAPLLTAPVSVPSTSLLVPEGQQHDNNGQDRLHNGSESQDDGQNDNSGGYKANMAVVFPAIASGVSDGPLYRHRFTSTNSHHLCLPRSSSPQPTGP